MSSPHPHPRADLFPGRSKAQPAPDASTSGRGSRLRQTSSTGTGTLAHIAVSASMASSAGPAKRLEPAAEALEAAAPAGGIATTAVHLSPHAATAAAGVATAATAEAGPGTYPSPRPSWQGLVQRLSGSARTSSVTSVTRARHQDGAAGDPPPHEAGLSPQQGVPEYAGAHFGPAQAARLSYVFRTSSLYSPSAAPPPRPAALPKVPAAAEAAAAGPRLVTILSDTAGSCTTSSSSSRSAGGSSEDDSSNHSHQSSRGDSGDAVGPGAQCNPNLEVQQQQHKQQQQPWPLPEAQQLQPAESLTAAGGPPDLSGIQSMVSPRRLQITQQQGVVQATHLGLVAAGSGTWPPPQPGGVTMSLTAATTSSSCIHPATGPTSHSAASGDPVNAEYAHWCEVVDRVVDRLQGEALVVQEELEGLTGVREWLGRMVDAMPPPPPPQTTPSRPAATNSTSENAASSSGGRYSRVVRGGAAEALGDVR